MIEFNILIRDISIILSLCTILSCIFYPLATSLAEGALLKIKLYVLTHLNFIFKRALHQGSFFI